MITLPPFKAFLASNIPSVYDNTLSYYDELTKLIAYLEQQVVPAVNETAGQVDGIKKGLEELKSYVDNYFENLDVQEEINNKLDEMAAGGQLAGIIAQFLEMSPVFAYGTIAEMAAADNLSNGCIARVLGNTAAADGDGAYYKVRTKGEGETGDGVQKVEIGDTLIADRIKDAALDYKLNHIRFGAIATADDIQAAIDLPGEKVIEFAKGQTYTLSKALHITSGTTLELNGATLYFNFIDPTDETLGIYNYKFDDTFTGYGGAQNVAIKNGYIKQGCVVLMHGNGTLLENIEFIDMYCRHCIQIAGCRDTKIKNCIFNGVDANDSIGEGSEVINIDPCVYAAQPYMPEASVMYDDAANNGVFVEGCVFKDAADESHKFYVALGAHMNYNDYRIFTYNLTVKDCIFGTPNFWAICLQSMEGVLIDSNQLYGNPALSRDDGTYFIITRAANNKVVISNNVVKNVEQFFHSGFPVALSTNIALKSNTIETIDNTNNEPAIWLLATNDVNVSENTIISDGPTLAFNGYSEGSITSTGLTVSNNTFEDTTDSNVIILKDAAHINILGNSLSNQTDATGHIILFNNVSNIDGVKNNKISNKQKLVNNIVVVNKNFINNGAMYQEIDWFSEGSTSATGSFRKNITNFRKLILQLGTGTNSQVVELNPWFYNGNYMDDRTYKFAVVNNDNTYGYGTLTISGSGDTYTYAGSIALRGMWGSDS